MGNEWTVIEERFQDECEAWNIVSITTDEMIRQSGDKKSFMHIERSAIHGMNGQQLGGGVLTLTIGNAPYIVATVYRDDSNFSILILNIKGI